MPGRINVGIACSESTFYRAARAQKLTGDPRRTRRAAARRAPVAQAGWAGQLWSWDITTMHGPQAGQVWEASLDHHGPPTKAARTTWSMRSAASMHDVGIDRQRRHILTGRGTTSRQVVRHSSQE